MYQGNLYEFVETLNTYCRREFNIDVGLIKQVDEQLYLVMECNGYTSYRVVVDTVDFEDQCYVLINNFLNRHSK